MMDFRDDHDTDDLRWGTLTTGVIWALASVLSAIIGWTIYAYIDSAQHRHEALQAEVDELRVLLANRGERIMALEVEIKQCMKRNETS